MENRFILKGDISVGNKLALLGDISTFKVIKTPLQGKTAIPSKEAQIVEPDEGYALSRVTVEPIPDNYIDPEGSLLVKENGTYEVRDYNEAVVDIYVRKSAEEKDVNFFDYDGLIFRSYTADEFAELTELPENPDHSEEGLTAQGWNWSLEDAKEYVADYGMLDIGQMYTTSDGKTRIWYEPTEGQLDPSLTISPNGSVLIDWGDGNTETVTGTSAGYNKLVPHLYENPGKYVITIEPVDSSTFGLNSALINKSNYSVVRENKVYRAAIKKVHLGRGIVSLGSSTFSQTLLEGVPLPKELSGQIGAYVFNQMYSVKFIAIPTEVTLLGSSEFSGNQEMHNVSLPKGLKTVQGSIFSGTTNIRRVIIPPGLTEVGDSMFASCYALSKVTIPSTITKIKSSAFSTCDILKSLVIPDSVTSILTKAFNGCYGLEFIKFKSITPPTVENSDAFNSISTDCKILVPRGSLQAYTAAANYPDPSVYTYEEY